jgi:hypothetical protein
MKEGEKVSAHHIEACSRLDHDVYAHFTADGRSKDDGSQALATTQ